MGAMSVRTQSSEQPAEAAHRAGFACFVGRPNAGKSTLTNALVGQKVAITANQPQTTRHTVRGIVHRPDAQLILVDTPGLHKPRTLLGERLNDVVRTTWAEVDVIGFCLPANEKLGPGDRFIAKELASIKKTPKIAIVTKTDLVEGQRYLLVCLVGDQVVRSTITYDPNRYIVDPALLAQTAERALPLLYPVPSTAPPSDGTQLTGVPTWLWIDEQDFTSVSASIAIANLSVTATAQPARVVWKMGDGSPDVVCDGPGTPYRPDVPDADQHSNSNRHPNPNKHAGPNQYLNPSSAYGHADSNRYAYPRPCRYHIPGLSRCAGYLFSFLRLAGWHIDPARASIRG